MLMQFRNAKMVFNLYHKINSLKVSLCRTIRITFLMPNAEIRINRPFRLSKATLFFSCINGFLFFFSMHKHRCVPRISSVFPAKHCFFGCIFFRQPDFVQSAPVRRRFANFSVQTHPRAVTVCFRHYYFLHKKHTSHKSDFLNCNYIILP